MTPLLSKTEIYWPLMQPDQHAFLDASAISYQNHTYNPRHCRTDPSGPPGCGGGASGAVLQGSFVLCVAEKLKVIVTSIHSKKRKDEENKSVQMTSVLV